MKNIAFFQSDLDVGGIQKSLVNLLNSLDFSRVTVDLFIFSKPENIESIPSKVNVILLKPFSKWVRLLPFQLLRFFYSKSINDKEYDFSIDYNGYWPECALAAINVRSLIKIMWVHTDVKTRLTLNRKYRFIWRASFSKLKYFNRFVAVSQGSADSFIEVSKVNVPVMVIPNILRPQSIYRLMDDPISLKLDHSYTNLVSVGRLTSHKGFDDLIISFSQAIKQRPDLRLYIIGEGPYRNKIQYLVKKLNLSTVVYLVGSTDNPYAIMNQMDAFVFASRYEGQAIVLNEAQILGLPILVTKNLEKFNIGIHGVEDLTDAMIHFEKCHKVPSDLDQYHQYIKNKLSELFESNDVIHKLDFLGKKI